MRLKDSADGGRRGAGLLYGTSSGERYAFWSAIVRSCGGWSAWPVPTDQRQARAKRGERLAR
ncbi:hypothetical protein [Paenibacillus rubinfantis]|uniref:hypothetical protein n=1 Tax=Paenibacillus rubinfantis TaxID=1720296 RepID=UPI0011DD1684|nr:hypothetical protein [Paenibacillus rubinfantis]